MWITFFMTKKAGKRRERKIFSERGGGEKKRTKRTKAGKAEKNPICCVWSLEWIHFVEEWWKILKRSRKKEKKIFNKKREKNQGKKGYGKDWQGHI